MFVTSQLEGDYSNLTAHLSQNILAGISKDGAVVLFDEDLNLVLNSQPNTKNFPIHQLCWHPTKRFLVIIWQNGSIGLWCIDATDSSVREGNLHSSSITSYEWSPTGNRIITGDEDGAVVVWKVDNRGKLSTLSQYRLRGAINHVTFKTNVTNLKDAKSKDIEPPFFISDSTGTIFFADEMGHCTESIQLQAKINLMKYHDGRDLLLVLTHDLLFSHYFLNADGKLILDTAWSQVKFGGGTVTNSNGSISSVIIDQHLIAYSINKETPRIWDSENEETFFLEKPGIINQDASYLNLAYSKKKDILAVSTNTGYIILWSRQNAIWEPMQKIEMTGVFSKLIWGLSDNTLCITKEDGFHVLSEQLVHIAGSKGDVFASQISSKSILLESATKKFLSFETRGKIKGIAISKEALVVWDGSKLDLYLLNGLNPSFQYSLPCSNSQFSLNQTVIFSLSNDRTSISVNHITSHTAFVIASPSSDGDICAISSTDARITNCKIFKSFEIGKQDAKLIASRKIESHLDEFENLLFNANTDGSFFAFSSPSDPNTLSVYCVESDRVFTYDCGSKIKSFCWDSIDARILGAQTFPTGKESNQQSHIISFFATAAQLVFKDIQLLPLNADTLISISLPNQHYFKKTEFKAEQSERFMATMIKEYSGIAELDVALIKTISDFSFKLAVGNLDEATRVVKLIKNEAVWENMSQACIKMRRTKLARLCMSKLKNVKGLRTISWSQNFKDDNALAAQLALHLGLYEEAKEIWSETGNFAQLISYYQSSGEWEKAIETSSKKDRTSLPTTYFRFAHHLAECDKIGAIAAFEKSNASKAQILRMMLDEPDELQKYVDSSTNTEIKKWWAQNAEGHGDVEEALKYYTDIDDVISIVRVYCRTGDLKKATELASLHPNNLVAAYYIAREFEKEKNWTDAIAYYSKSKCFNSAIRIAKEKKIDKELLQLALQSTSVHMLDVAKYFEKMGDFDKAITLYSKSGNVPKALALCYKTKNTSMMESIICHLDPVTDESSMKNISNFLADHGSHESALKLLISSGKYVEALDLIEKQNSNVTEDLFNSFKPTKSMNDEDLRVIYKRLGALCLLQGSHQLSCKSYTLAGDRLNAMGALLKSGEKDKIITFANVSRSSEIFIIAANYLQTLNWVNDVTVMRTIIQFYTKAKAFRSLGRFYESCAQVEIDEFQNYEKALGALNEAESCYQKETGDNLPNDIKLKKSAIELYLQAVQQGREGDVEKCENVCAELLNFNDIDDFVRIGDILGLLIETNYKAGNITKAKELFKRLQARSVTVSVNYYVDDAICEALDENKDLHDQIDEHII